MNEPKRSDDDAASMGPSSLDDGDTCRYEPGRREKASFNGAVVPRRRRPHRSRRSGTSTAGFNGAVVPRRRRPGSAMRDAPCGDMASMGPSSLDDGDAD